MFQPIESKDASLSPDFARNNKQSRHLDVLDEAPMTNTRHKKVKDCVDEQLEMHSRLSQNDSELLNEQID